MPDPQLTDRLRDACALPHEPRPGRAVGESLASRLPRYRNRRRAALSGSLGGVAVVLALVLVVALGGFSTGPPKAPPVASPDLQCVEVQVGGAQAHCSGHIYVSSASANATLSPSAAQGLGAGPSVPTVRIAPGRRITLSLP
ncbi:MAG: hypothetical protein ACRDYB_11925, partial [Acidimicrobiales bacterium]